MTTPSTDPETLRARAAEIARGLSEAQRDVVTGPTKRAFGEILALRGYLPTYDALARKGILKDHERAFTDFGLAVREYLQGNPHDD